MCIMVNLVSPLSIQLSAVNASAISCSTISSSALEKLASMNEFNWQRFSHLSFHPYLLSKLISCCKSQRQIWLKVDFAHLNSQMWMGSGFVPSLFFRFSQSPLIFLFGRMFPKLKLLRFGRPFSIFFCSVWGNCGETLRAQALRVDVCTWCKVKANMLDWPS